MEYLRETEFCGYHSECVLRRTRFSEQSFVVGVGLRELTLLVAFIWNLAEG